MGRCGVALNPFTDTRRDRAAAGVVKYTHARTGAICTTGPLPVGQHSIWARRIWATGTTATGLTGWQ